MIVVSLSTRADLDAAIAKVLAKALVAELHTEIAREERLKSGPNPPQDTKAAQIAMNPTRVHEYAAGWWDSATAMTDNEVETRCRTKRF
jgi:hypothetical protein